MQIELSHRGVETSILAGKKASHSASDVKFQIVQALRYQLIDGATSDELAAFLRIPYKSTQPRCSDMRSAGHIVDSGLRRPNADGNMVIVWRLA